MVQQSIMQINANESRRYGLLFSKKRSDWNPDKYDMHNIWLKEILKIC